MLIRRTDTRLHLVTQPDHGALTGFLARQWGGGGFALPDGGDHSSARLAAELHDCGWDELDATPLFCPQRAAPYDFLSHPTGPRLAAYTAGIERVLREDENASMLMSMHFAGIYEGFFGLRGPAHVAAARRMLHSLPSDSVEKIRRFVANENARIQAWRSRPGWDYPHLALHYLLLQVWDRLSLLCGLTAAGEPVPDMIRGIVLGYPDVPTGRGAATAPLEVWWRESGVLALRPYPLCQPEAYFDLPVRHLPARTYRDQLDLEQAWKSAEAGVLRLTFVPG